MTVMVIDINELRSKSGGEAVEDLAAFLKEHLGTEIDSSAGTLSLDTEKQEKRKITRPHLRQLLRKFLHKTELKEDFRVIAGKENSFIIKERKTTEEEE